MHQLFEKHPQTNYLCCNQGPQVWSKMKMMGPSIYRICSDTSHIYTDTTISPAMIKKPRQKY